MKPGPTTGRRILVTGGAGYIGSHSLLPLLERGHAVCVLDNFCNSRPETLAVVERLAQRPVLFRNLDLRDGRALSAALHEFHPDAVIHLAGLKSPSVSVADPLPYYDNNLVGLVRLLAAMDAIGCGRLLFSSSAAVYGATPARPVTEAQPLDPRSPYGRSKAIMEQIVTDWTLAHPGKAAISLRYFNPIGAHGSGRIGDAPNGIPDSLLPLIARVAAGIVPELAVHGADFQTRDGTGERDYLHVMDLARGNLAALDHLWTMPAGHDCFNLGAGAGVTVLEMIAAFESATGRQVPYRIAARRPGDCDVSIADTGRARQILGWRPEHTLQDGCRAAWHWQIGQSEDWAVSGPPDRQNPPMPPRTRAKPIGWLDPAKQSPTE